MTKRKFHLVFVLAFCFVLPQFASATQFKNIIAFGDSLSDNAFDDGHGFRRYSNGKVWVEYLGEMLGSGLIEVRAWGGAMSGQGNFNPPAKDWSGLFWQLDKYTPTTKMDQTLFTIEIGINDLHDPNNKITPQQVVENIVKAMERLAAKGAKYIMIWNIPTSITFPGYTDEKYEWYSYYAPLKDGAYALFGKFNELIDDAVADFDKKHPDVTVYFFDFDGTMKEIKTKFEDTTNPWLGSYLYPKAGKWMWWDHWHFMTETHKYIAERAYDLIKKE
jgi:phospholipase/lecithinase/hemolysin